MTIGIDASRANLLHKTGTEWYSFYLIKSLAEIDRRNRYILYLNQPPRPDLVEAVAANPNFSFRLLRWPFYSFWTLGRLTLEMLWRRPDVLFIPAHVLPLFSPKKTVTTIHDVAFRREAKLYHSSRFKTDVQGVRPAIDFFVRLLTLGRYRSGSVDYLHWSTIFALRHAQKIITVSDFTRREIMDLYPETEAAKITAIHNGYPSRLFFPINDEERVAAVLEKYNLERPFFLYAGRLEKKKNTQMLVEAFAWLRESRPEIKQKLVLIGNAGYGYDEVRYTIQQYNLEDEVLMPGWADEEDLPYLFNAASAFVFPSKHEGFGIPILQALACGLPTTCSDLAVLREVAADAVLYFDPNNRQEMAAAMARIVTDDQLRQELRAKGLERVKDFSWRRCAEETLRVIEGL